MKEIRVARIEARSNDAAAAGHVLTGRPIVYDEPTTIHAAFGDYKEIIKRGALDNADLSDVRLLYNHDANRIPLARTPKTMELRADSQGLAVTAHLPDTEEGRSVYTAVQRGDLSGMSFAFTVADGGSHYDARANTRTISAIKKVYETSIVPFPAYPQTSVEARSAIQSGRQREQLKIKINKLLMKEI